LLDGWVLLGRPSLRAGEEALRRWLNAASLVRPGPAGGEVIVVAEASLPVVQALIRWDPATYAERELAERNALRFPPAVRMAAVSGGDRAVAGLLAAAELPPDAEVLGPVAPDGGPGPAGSAEPASRGAAEDGAAAGNGTGDRPEDTVRMLVRVPRSGSAVLARALQAAQAVRSARKDVGQVRVQLDPAELI
jgi:primosomal protein N' (replication factor Y)